MSSDSILGRQQQFNAGTFDNWLACESHRKRITGLLIPDHVLNRLTLFGVGNANDVDLAILSEHYAKIELVDIDREALTRGLDRQSAIQPHCEIVLSEFDLSDGSWRGPKRAERTASLCMFSQLVGQLPVRDGVKEEKVLRLRERHFDMLVANTANGGEVVFVTDLVSAVTAPELKCLQGDPLRTYISQLLIEGNFFTGTNPKTVSRQFSQHRRVQTLKVLEPWVWSFGLRCFAVYAIVAELK